MPHRSLAIDHSNQWYVLLRGERLGPFSREALRALLVTEPDGFQAPVWRLGMLDWQAAASLSALTAEAPFSESPSPIAPKANATDEWAAVGTSELSAIGTSELRALSAQELRPAETNEWAAVGTSELRALGTSELRMPTTNPQSAPTISELRAFTMHDLQQRPAPPSVIISGETATELPSFNFRAERSAPSPARGAATPTPTALPVHTPVRVNRPPSRARLFLIGGLIVLSALALGTALTLRWLRAAERSGSHERAAPGAPLLPQAPAPLDH